MGVWKWKVKREKKGGQVCSSHRLEGEIDEGCELVSGMELSIGEQPDRTVPAHLFKAVKNNNGTAILLLSDLFAFQDSSITDFAYRVACNGFKYASAIPLSHSTTFFSKNNFSCQHLWQFVLQCFILLSLTSGNNWRFLPYLDVLFLFTSSTFEHFSTFLTIHENFTYHQLSFQMCFKENK